MVTSYNGHSGIRFASLTVFKALQLSQCYAALCGH